MSQPIELKKEKEIQKSEGPVQQAWQQYKKNRAAIVGSILVVLFAFVALTAQYWTSAGILDHPRGYKSTHTLNPVGWERIDSFADPGQCARDNIDQGQQWCSVLSEEQKVNYASQCPVAEPDLDQRQWCFLLGSDGSGKDVLTQTVYGAQISLAVAILGAVVSLVVGTIYGVISGYYGGRLDNFMMRFIDFLFGMPGLILIILMQVFFRGISREYDGEGGLMGLMIGLNTDMGGLLFLFIAVGMLSWLGIARLARGQVLSFREKEFVEAARAVGANDRRIIFTHLLPNVLGPLLVVVTLSVPGFIFLEAFLSFIGLGVQPGVPSWGQMIAATQQNGGLRSNQHLILVPSIALVLLTLGFNFVGDGLRDALDPRLRGR